MTIFNDCANDSIQFNNAIPSPQNVDLFFGLEALIIDPAVSQYNSACPRSCSLTVDPAYQALVSSFSSADGVLALASDNQSLDGASFDVTIECISTDSTGPGFTTTPQTIEIRTWDYCRKADILMPTFDPTYLARSLWTETLDAFAPGVAISGCGSV